MKLGCAVPALIPSGPIALVLPALSRKIRHDSDAIQTEDISKRNPKRRTYGLSFLALVWNTALKHIIILN